jgi:hypothetical protein
MDCGQCEPWVLAIQHHYAYLFAEHAFQLVHCQDARQGEHCLIVLESPQARLKFEIDQGTPVIYFGTLDSPLGWEQQVDGVTVWYVDNALLNFVESQAGTPASASARAAGPAPRTTEALLAAGAERLRPHAAELIAAFAPDRPAGWWQAFDAYQAERLKQIRQRMRPR